ncbi:cytochrome P450 [Chytridium lagenaria]|nr:cytochrome P450 [Chytridium lagenaria]
MTVDPAVVEYILKTNFENFVKGPQFHEMLEPMLGDGIFNTDGDTWRWQRKISSHIFTGKNFRNVLSKVITEDLEILFNEIARHTGDSIDIYAYLHNFTMDTFGKIAFGVDLQTLQNGTSDFAVAFDTTNVILAKRFINPLYSLSEYVNGSGKVLKDAVDTMTRFANDRIQEKRARKRDAKGYKDLLDLYMDATVDGEGLTDKQLRDMVLNMMIAGRDTTAQTLSWVFWVLASRKDVVDGILDELKEVTGGNIPTYDEVPLLKYSNAVLFETLRLYPSIAAGSKICVTGDVLPGGLHIRKGTQINWLNYAMGRMEHIWGHDATSFNPSRWIDSDGNLKREPAYKFPAFNAGPRTCLGQQMAIVECVMTMSGLLTRFEFVVDDAVKVEIGVGLTLNMKNGMRVKVLQRRVK